MSPCHLGASLCHLDPVTVSACHLACRRATGAVSACHLACHRTTGTVSPCHFACRRRVAVSLCVSQACRRVTPWSNCNQKKHGWRQYFIVHPENVSLSRRNRVTVSLWRVTVSLWRVTVSLWRVTVSLPRVTVSLPRVTVSLPRVTVSLPRVTVSLPRVTVSPYHPPVSPCHCATVSLHALCAYVPHGHTTFRARRAAWLHHWQEARQSSILGKGTSREGKTGAGSRGLSSTTRMALQP